MTQEEEKIIDIVKKSSPAVVSVIITKNKENKFNFKKNKNTEIFVGGGSGFLISPDGLILTNRHVVQDKDEIYKIETSDKKKYPAKILAKDPINDIAILKIDGQNLPFLELENSTNLNLGQTVIAIGNALSRFHNSISKGIISGLFRVVSTENEGEYEMQNLRGLIQTDAAINPGNSGGPLLNTEGKVVGINAVVVSGADNISFAIPIKRAINDIAQYKKYGKIKIPSLGVRYIIINNNFQEKYNLPVNYGAWIVKEHLPSDHAIVPGSSADIAGIKEDDIILELNNIKIDENNNLDNLVQKHKIGEIIKLKILRKNKEKIIKAKLKERK